MNRRHFLQAAAGTLFVAPAILHTENVMKLWVPPERKWWLDPLQPFEEVCVVQTHGRYAKVVRLDFNLDKAFVINAGLNHGLEPGMYLRLTR